MNHNTSGPWWQHRWPWIILFMLSSVIVACMVTIYIAVTTRDSLVADDYSKHGRGINQRLEKDQRALELGVQAKLGYALNASQGSELTIELLAPEPQGTSAGPGDIGTPSAFLILQLS
ncbi:MAG: FixH family protein, partial [Burkholderiaceae bacterium]